jgi:nitrogen regulatory protein P-II 1
MGSMQFEARLKMKARAIFGHFGAVRATSINRPLNNSLKLGARKAILRIGSGAGACARPRRVEAVKRIEAIIQPFKINDLKDRLQEHDVLGMTAYEVRGFGRQKGHSEIYRGSEYQVDFIAKIKIEVVVPDDRADEIIDLIVKEARTGEIGDGKIFVSDITQAVRIRTGEVNEEAL